MLHPARSNKLGFVFGIGDLDECCLSPMRFRKCPPFPSPKDLLAAEADLGRLSMLRLSRQVLPDSIDRKSTSDSLTLRFSRRSSSPVAHRKLPFEALRLGSPLRWNRHCDQSLRNDRREQYLRVARGKCSVGVGRTGVARISRSG